MRAVGLFTHGGPDVLQVVEVPEVHAGPGQVRIRVHAATVNPTDVGVRNGTRAEQQKADPPPYVPGMEAAGIVDEVGSGVPDRLKLGDAVMAIVVPKGSHGAYREQIVLDARSVARAPAGKTHAEACTLPMNGLTARQSLDLLKLSSGQVIAVTGAAGAYGGYVVQLAKAEGLTVIADASEKDEKLVASLGADIVVRRGDDVASRIRGRFPQGVDGLADGAVLKELVIPAVRDGGSFTSVRGFQGIPQRNIHFTATSVRSYAQEFEKLDRRLRTGRSRPSSGSPACPPGLELDDQPSSRTTSLQPTMGVRRSFRRIDLCHAKRDFARFDLLPEPILPDLGRP